MTIAGNIKQAIETNQPQAFSLHAGYGMNVGGQYVRYSAGVLLREVRNDKGRCTMAVYQYADDSKLTYRYRDDRYTLDVE